MVGELTSDRSGCEPSRRARELVGEHIVHLTLLRSGPCSQPKRLSVPLYTILACGVSDMTWRAAPPRGLDRKERASLVVRDAPHLGGWPGAREMCGAAGRRMAGAAVGARGHTDLVVAVRDRWRSGE